MALVAVLTSCGGRPAGEKPSGGPRSDIQTRRSALRSDVAVTLLDGWGNPIAGQWIAAIGEEGPTAESGQTNSQGVATISLDDGTYFFRVNYGTYFESATCATPGCTAATIQLTKPVQVTVTNGSGAPLVDQLVIAIADDNSQASSATTDSLGVASVYVVPGSYLFRVVTGGMYFDSSADKDCTVPGCTSASIAVAHVLVTVKGSNGIPAAGVTVAAIDADLLAVNWTDTDSAGHADMFVPLGAYKFRVVANGDYYESGPDGHCVLPGCTTASITIPACVGQDDGAVCDDGDPCSEFDECSGGTCQGSRQFACVTPDSCQLAGTCNPGKASPTPPSTQDLIAWWRLEGDGADATGGGHTLDEGGAVRAPGRVGYGMKFDGSSCMSAPIWDDARMQNTSGLTVMAWINANDPAGCPYPDQYGQRAVMGRGYDYSFAVMCYSPAPGPGVTGAVRAAGAQQWGHGGGVGFARPDEWHHVATTWDHSWTFTYLDGRLVQAFQGPSDVSDMEPQFMIGCLTSYFHYGDEHWRHFVGTVDEAMLYGRALSPQEIWSYYSAADPCAPHEALPDNTACHDGDLCTLGDRCQSGTCTATSPPITCTPFDSCHEAPPCISWAGCHPHTPAPVKPDGTACDDGDLCTQDSVCQTGVCSSGTPVTCTAADQCHAAPTCSPGTGCNSAPLDDGTTCDDGDPCTISDTCNAGSCAGTPKSCGPVGPCQLEGACDPTTGACSNPFVADGTACDDANLCTTQTTCQAGVCKGGEATSCPATDECHIDGACDPATGACTNPLAMDLTPCHDGNACTINDVCVQGTCQPGSPQPCVATDACHLAGTCNPASGACSNPENPDPSCSGYQPPPVREKPQPTGLVPREVTSLDPATGTITITTAPAAGAANPPSTNVVVPALVGTHVECTADVNGDQMIDIVFTDTAAGTMKYLPRRDLYSPVYGDPVDLDLAVPAGEPGPAACADTDGDGIVEVVASFATPEGGDTTPTIVVYRITGGPTAQRIVVPTGFPAGVAVGGLALADFDGDGRRDLAAYAANNQPLLDSQLFVFPHGGFMDYVTSGELSQPFSSATRVSLPNTDVLASAETPNWGSLTTLDADADGRADIWALGNRGIVLLYRSTGGFGFDQPELDGYVSNLQPKFTIGQFDGTGDGIADLLVDPWSPGGSPQIKPQIFRGLGGGNLFRDPLDNPYSGIKFTPIPPVPPKAFTFEIPAADADVGLLRGTPVATTYPDDKGVNHPSILVQAVNGHLVERVEFVQVTTRWEDVPPTPGSPPIVVPPLPINNPDSCGIRGGTCTVNPGGGGTTTITTEKIRVETRTNIWRWIDHGAPETGNASFPRATLVDSLPAVAYDSTGSIVKRRVYVRGLDGHLWVLVQDGSLKYWTDRGFPGRHPLVASPSVVSDVVDGHSVNWVYILDAGGGLNRYIDVDQPWTGWEQLGLIGSENCFGSAGVLGSGSPKAISWVSDSNVKHQQVFVVGGKGDLFSWRDGVWEEILDAQYQVRASDIMMVAAQLSYQGCTPPSTMEHGCTTAIPICPNAPPGVAPSPPGPAPNDPESIYGPNRNNSNHQYEHYQSRPPYVRANNVGTPAAIVYDEWGVGLKRVIVVRNSTGGFNQYLIIGDAPVVPAGAVNRPSGYKTPVVNLGMPNANGNQTVTFPEQPTVLNSFETGFCMLDGDSKDVRDTAETDPLLVMDSHAVINLLTTDFGNEGDVNHSLTIGHRGADTPTQWEFEHREIATLQPFNAVAGTAAALSSSDAVSQTIGADLAIWVVRSNGILLEANSSSNGAVAGTPGWHWRSCTPVDPPVNPDDFSEAGDLCPTQVNCTEQGSFNWLAVNLHAPPNVPTALHSMNAQGINGADNPKGNCKIENPLDIILPQWVSPQRRLSADVENLKKLYAPANPPNFRDNQASHPREHGYNSDVMIRVEGTVLKSHVAAIDAPIDHSHGPAGDIPRVRHDWNIMVALDKEYQRLLSDANILAGGIMELEWEMPDHLVDENGVKVLKSTNQPLMPDGFTRDAIPAVGDRVAVRGRFMFDCGHPPYRAEIHPIDIIAVMHGRYSAKAHSSMFGGQAWYQPGDVNLPGQSDVLTRFEELAEKYKNASRGKTGFGPLDEFIGAYGLVQNIIDDVRFVVKNGCGRNYDTELMAPANALSFPYEHSTTDLFSSQPLELNVCPTPLQCVVPIYPEPSELFSFRIHGTPFTKTVGFNGGSVTEVVFDGGVPPRSLHVCFTRVTNWSHDTVDPDDDVECGICLGSCAAFCLGSPNAATSLSCQSCLFVTQNLCPLATCCDKDTSEELVTWITAGDQAKIYEDQNGDPNKNCLDVNVYPEDTLRIGSHGFECDFSCGEHWDDPNFAAAGDERIGTTSLAFTAAGNWGIQQQPYIVLSQPDLATPYSRDKSAGDYFMGITIRENQ